jgi:hypothetical protein
MLNCVAMAINRCSILIEAASVGSLFIYQAAFGSIRPGRAAD